MKVFSIEVNICATAYIKADTAEEARAKAAAIVNDGLEFSDRHQSIHSDVCVDGGPFSGLADNSEDLALSPVMTVTGICDGASFVEEIEDDADD